MTDQAVQDDQLSQLIQCESFSLAIKLIDAIPMFHGNIAELEFFVKQMDAAYAAIDGFKLSDDIRKLLEYQFFHRLSPEVLQRAYISTTKSWQEARSRLCFLYGGFQRPLKKYASIIVNLGRDESESSVEFAQRLNVEMRLLKWRILEEINEKTEASTRCIVYEELALENLRHQIPDFRVLRMAKTIVEAIQLLKKEEKAIEHNRQQYQFIQNTQQFY